MEAGVRPILDLKAPCPAHWHLVAQWPELLSGEGLGLASREVPVAQ